MSDSLTVDVVADLVCPWCFIGMKNLEAALAQTVGETATGSLVGTPTLVQHQPFLLDPALPVEGADLRERLRMRYGGDPDAMFSRVEAAGRAAGIPLDFSKVRRVVNTVAAHTLLGAAAKCGTQQALAMALYDAYFLQGRDIGKSAVLVELAAAHGLDPDSAQALVTDTQALQATRDKARQAAAGGVQGVPFFVFNQKLAVSGAQPAAVLADAITRTLAPS